jgi:hypothetical protein
MQKWEYMWMYVAHEKGKNVYIANGERLESQTHPEALNAVGKEGWELVAIFTSPIYLTTPNFPQFCLKRPISDWALGAQAITPTAGNTIRSV